MKVEITSRAARVLGVLAAVALLLVAAVAAVLLPYVPRLVRAAQALPVAVQVVGTLPSTQHQVERIDGNVQTLTPPVTRATRSLKDIAPQLRTLSQQLAATELTIGQLRAALGTPATHEQAGLAGQLDQLQSSVGSVAAALQPLGPQLTPLSADLHRLAGEAGALPTSLDRVNASLAVLDALPAYLAQLQKTLDVVAVHVADLDRKTGPVIGP